MDLKQGGFFIVIFMIYIIWDKFINKFRLILR